VCTLDRCCEYQRTHLLHARYKMCICAMYTHVYMHMYMYIYMWMHVHIHIYMYVFLYVYMHMYMDVYMCVRICICVYIYICTYMYVYIYMYMSLHRMYVQFVSFNTGEWGWGSWSMRALVAWSEGLFWTEGKIGVLSVSSLFLTRVG